MKKIMNELRSYLFVAGYLVGYFYLKHSGLWASYRWTGLAFGAAWAILYILFPKKERTNVFGLRFAIFFCLAGVVVLLTFLTRPGDSGDGFMAMIFLGFGAPELYAHYKKRRLKMEDKASST
jgi:hypothetical protein